MRAILYPSEISGRVAAPPSKSMAHRALICAALAKGESRVLNLSASQDITATLAAMRLLGASAADMDAPECRRGAAAAYAHWSGERTVSGPGSLILKGTGGLPFAPVSGPVDCCESGSTLRFLIPLFSLTDAPVRFTGRGRLMERPQGVYARMFAERGLGFAQDADGITVRGALSAGEYTLAGNISASSSAAAVCSSAAFRRQRHSNHASVREPQLCGPDAACAGRFRRAGRVHG